MTKKNSTDSVRVKLEFNEDGKEPDLALHARDRLKGALQQQVGHSDSSDSEEFKSKHLIKKMERDKGMSRKKRLKLSTPVKEPQTQQNSFVMKLFDRSVDLAQFEETTPLYPICRAWMANAPRTSSSSKRLEKERLKKLKREEKREKARSKADDGKEVYSLPPPLPRMDYTDLFPIPTKTANFTLDYDKPLPSREILLASHKTHWGEVKKKVRLAALRNDERHEASKQILRRIYNTS